MYYGKLYATLCYEQMFVSSPENWYIINVHGRGTTVKLEN